VSVSAIGRAEGGVVSLSKSALALCAVSALLLIVPTVAMAKTGMVASRIAGVPMTNLVLVTEPSGTPTAPVVTGKVSAYRRARHRYMAVSGTVKLYLRVYPTGTWSLVASQWRQAGKSFALPLAVRGLYRIHFVGSDKVLSSDTYTLRLDEIPATVSTPTITLEPVNADYSRVNIATTVSWNTDAYQGIVGIESVWLPTEDSSLASLNSGVPWMFYPRFNSALVQCPRPDTYNISTTIKNEDLKNYIYARSAVIFMEPYVTTSSSPATGTFFAVR
jgi:hypothetical protein